jgi:hypothetical protein
MSCNKIGDAAMAAVLLDWQGIDTKNLLERSAICTKIGSGQNVEQTLELVYDS